MSGRRFGGVCERRCWGRPIKHLVSSALLSQSKRGENRRKWPFFRSGNAADPFAHKGGGVYSGFSNPDAACDFGVALSVLKSGFQFRQRDFAPVFGRRRNPIVRRQKRKKRRNTIIKCFSAVRLLPFFEKVVYGGVNGFLYTLLHNGENQFLKIALSLLLPVLLLFIVASAVYPHFLTFISVLMLML